MISKRYHVIGMCCGECELTILDKVVQVRGVEVAKASACTGILVIESSTPVDTLDVLDAVNEAGFTASLHLCENLLNFVPSDSQHPCARHA